MKLKTRSVHILGEPAAILQSHATKGIEFHVNQKGFTLIEILIAIAILAVGIIGIVALFHQSYSHIGNAGRLSVMNHLGQRKLDQLKTLSYSDPDLTNGIHPSPVPERITYMDGSKNVYKDYSITWEVRDDQPEQNMKTVIIEVGHQLYGSSSSKLPASEAMNQKVIRFQYYMSR